jgi:chromosome partitioning protein
MIIVIGGTKGGTGKSTLVTNLVAIDVDNGKDSLLVDSDKQASASAWSTVRDESTLGLVRVPSVQKYGQIALTNELKSLAKKYDNIFVDAGGYDSEELRAAILAADRLFIPLRPAQFDVWTLPRIERIVNESNLYNPKIKSFFIINGAHTNPVVKEVDDVRELVEPIEHVTLCRTVIRTRRAFTKAPSSGMAVTELKGSDRDPKAIDEILSFYNEVFNG